jgi:hypothetical protein
MPKLREGVGRPRAGMIRPHDVRPDVWDTLTAAATGNVKALKALLGRDPALASEGYWYTPPLHFAVREGQCSGVRL